MATQRPTEPENTIDAALTSPLGSPRSNNVSAAVTGAAGAAAFGREVVESWTVEDVCEWLVSLRLPPAVVERFRANEIDHEELLPDDRDLDPEQLLDQVGVKKLAHRRKILDGLQAIPCLARRPDTAAGGGGSASASASANWNSLFADPSASKALEVAAQAVLDSWRPRRWVIQPPELGRGGSGVVFQSSDADLGPAVAIKLSYTGGDDLRVLQREARLMKRVAHERICRLYEDPYVSADRRVFGMVLELLDKGCLAQLIKGSPNNRIREFEVVRMAFDVLAALLFMHEKSVIHRDIKPSNIMLTEVDGHIIYKLIDLSISAVNQEARADVAQTLQTGTTSLGALAGTAHYMSPEQIAEGVVVTPQTDLWSLGVVMFECLSGVLPFAPAERDRFKICNAIVNAAAPELIDAVEEVGAISDGMDAFVSRALQKEFGLRFSSAAEMRAALDEMLTAGDDSAFGLFISYRVWCDKEFAEAFYRAASACQLRPGRENRLKVYLDKVRIVDGKRFDVNFAKGLANSTVFSPLVSASCLKNFVELGQEDKEDFVLAEWIMALELESRGIVKAIFPIVMGEQGQDGKYSQTFFEGLRDSRVTWPASDGFHDAGSGAIPDIVSAKSTAKAREFLSMLDPPVELRQQLTVDAVVKKILTFQAILLHFENDSIDAVDGIQMVRINSTHGKDVKEIARIHVAQTCAERVAKVVTAAIRTTAFHQEPSEVLSPVTFIEHLLRTGGAEEPLREGTSEVLHDLQLGDYKSEIVDKKGYYFFSDLVAAEPSELEELISDVGMKTPQSRRLRE
eukprot:COSAG06_NODE_7106_length_2631_cov_32.515798_1_plen_796_part_10